MYRPNVAPPSPTVDRNISTDCDPTINRESTDVSTNCWQTIDWQLTLISTDSRLTVDRYILANSRPMYISRLSTDDRPKIDQNISTDCEVTINRQSTDTPTDCRLPTDYRPNDHHRGHVQRSKKAWSLISPFGNKLIRKIPLVERSCVCLSRLCL